MSCKPMTKKEWAASVNEMWKSAVEFAYKDLIDEAVKAEREACAKVCEDYGLAEEMQAIGNDFAEAIRARGQA